MSIQNRPYVGTWQPNRRVCVQWTPDFLVYINGDTSLPGCADCRHNINIQEFVNSISVDFGVEPGASNCSISMAIPRHYGDSIFRDGNTLLRPGLEVHVYFRGYFPMKGMTTPEARPVAGVNLSDIPQHPYYPVFHGVVTSVSHEFSGGYHTATMTCNGMLHFWEKQKLSGTSGGSFFGARPVNSNIQTTLTGHPMTGKTPYAIIYSLYRDTAGAADGVGFALNSQSNYGAVNTTTRDPMYALTLEYWHRRFRGKIYNLRMHGASGQLFTSSAQAYLSMYGASSNSIGGSTGTATVSPSAGHEGINPFTNDPVTLAGLRPRDPRGGLNRQPVDTSFLPSNNENSRFGLDATQLQAYPTDIGAYGAVNLWESTYESKMDIAGAVVNVSGYEFYQDADGDLVFKPPLYNLDTSSSRVYRIEPEDIVSISFTESEPAATYAIIKGGVFQNMKGVVDESELGTRSTYIDYKLVAQFGWIETSVESTYYNNAKSAFYFAINHLDRINAGVNGASVTIPLRPEIRPGYPVYIPHIDCFYYVTSVAHAMNLGSECTTTLTLTARRRKFFAPGNTANVGTHSGDLPQVDLGNIEGNMIALQALDTSGVPRLVGFPNVVMAIDPSRINPMFQSIGFEAVERELTSGDATRTQTDIRNSRRELFVWRFIDALLENNTLGLPGTTEGSARIRDTTQVFTVAGITNTDGTAQTVIYDEVYYALENYITQRSRAREAKASLVNQAVLKQNEINDLRAGANADSGQVQAQISALEEAIRGLNGRVRNIEQNFEVAPVSSDRPQPFSAYETSTRELRSAIDDVPTVPGSAGTNRNPPRANTEGQINPRRVALMAYLIGRLRVSQTQSNDTTTDPSGIVNTSAQLLQQLSDRKASLSLSVPGFYRYYSASHPKVEQQGYLPIVGSTIEEGGAPTVGTVNERGEVSGTATTVRRERTQLSPQQAAGYLINAWRELHDGQSPPDNAAQILLAIWGHETSQGSNMWNNNFTNSKALQSGLRARLVSRNNGAALFQAYGNPEEGSRHFVRSMIAGQNRVAFQQYLDHPDIAQYAAALRANNYFGRNFRRGTTTPTTAAERAAEATRYENDLRRFIPQARGWIRDARPIGSSDGADTTTLRPAPVLSPTQSAISTVKVVPASNVSGIPEERQNSYVEVVPDHVPTNGLRVKVFGQGRNDSQVVPTNLIRTMTFEARRNLRLSSFSAPSFSPTSGPTLNRLVNRCISPVPNDPLVEALLTSLVTKAGGDTALTTPRPSSELLHAAVTGITGLRTATGAIASAPDVLNINGGVPNDLNVSPVLRITTAEDGRTVLRAKARALIQDVTTANISELAQAQDLLRQSRTITPEVTALVTPWQESIRALFRDSPYPNESGVAQRNTARHLVEGTNIDYSPVFPVSDEKGYEHYGSYQYGRGLSIEPGGNYERMMSADPVQYFTDEQRELWVRALHSGVEVRQERLSTLAATIAASPSFLASAGAQIALDFAQNQGSDRVSMITNGLRNFVFSDRDTVSKLPINNVAYQLSELTPMGQNDTCACKGAEADLLLAAYMAGSGGATFAEISSPGEAAEWVSSQMVEASEAWSEAQSKMRGMSEDQGRQSILDSVEGWNTVADNFRQTNTTLAGNLTTTAESGLSRLSAENRRIFTPIRE